MGVKIIQSRRGQMTIELAAVFPVLIIVALIATNALLFFRDCAVFDRIAHEAIRVHATAPAYGQGPGQSCALIEQAINDEFGGGIHEISVACSGTGINLNQYSATIVFHPTLFGMGLRSEVFGIALPRLSHTTSYVVDSYKPGVFV